MLSLVLVLAIGFMEYSIIDDSFSASNVPSQEVIKKQKKSQELVIARNMHMDDDDEDAVIKYTSHEFYHCDLMLQLHFVPPTQLEAPAKTGLASDLPSGIPVYALTGVYRI